MASLTGLQREVESLDSIEHASIERDMQTGETVLEIRSNEDVIDELDDICSEEGATFKPVGKYWDAYEYVLR